MVGLDLGLSPIEGEPMKYPRAWIVALLALVAPLRAMTGGLATETRTATLNVQGMTCGSCTASVRIVLRKIDGVADAEVSFSEKKAVVTYDPTKITPQKMADTINEKLPCKARVVGSGGTEKP